MLPSYFEFHNPVRIISGHRALDNLPYELEQLGASRPLIVTDRGVVDAGLVKHVLDAFGSSGMTVGAVFDDVPPDSSDHVVNRAAGVYRENQCDALVAVGGGSAIDTAKAVNIVITEQSDDLLKFMGAEMLKKPMKPLVVIPTTAGTGSEVTLVAVISHVEKQVKMAFTSRHLLPRLAVLDPRMTLTMPPRITAATGMDALTHAVEACVCLQKNPMSDAYAFAAIDLIRQHLFTAVEKGGDADARFAMANAAAMAGIAFSNSMVGMVHSLGHAAGAVCHIPHGVAMSVFLPFGLEYNLEKIQEPLGELLLPLGGSEVFAQTAKEDRPQRAIGIIRDWRKRLNDLCGLPETLKEAGAKKDQIGLIARTAISDPSLIFNPEEMEFDDAVKVIEKAFE